MGKIAKLVCVTDINNNKFYYMTENEGVGTFTAEWGRVDSTKSTKDYPMKEWDAKYRDKTSAKKGYTDVTHLYTEAITTNSTTVTDSTFISNDKWVKKLIEDLQRYANKTISENYKVSTKNVTQKMIDEAQLIIDEISQTYKTKFSKEQINSLLLKLFIIIPRRMGHVQDYLVQDGDNNERVAKIIDNEQSILDSLAGQVLIQEEVAVVDDKPKKKVSILETMGISVEHVDDANVISKVKRLMGDSSDKFSRLFEVTNFKTEKKYKTVDIENEELLFHGSRSENFFNILQTGLLIRPSGAVYSGSMFGDGIYFATKARKSIGYTSLSGSRWASGSNNVAYLALFSTNLGKQKIVHKHSSECYNFGEKTIAPYNSVFAKAGVSLMNDELIIYNSNRCTIKYLIEIKN
jgi:poly [ADP-ribose] polymerase